MKKSLVLIMLIVAIIATAAFGFMACSKKTAIGVQSGTAGEYFVKGSSGWGFDGFSNLSATPFQNGAMAVQAMKQGTVKAVIIDVAPAKALAAEIEGIKVIDIALTEEQYGYAVDKTQAKLLADINAIMATDEFATKKAAIMDAYLNNNEEAMHPVTAKTSQGSDPSKELVVATNAEFPPFEYKIGEKFAGIDMEIAAYFAEKLDLDLVILDMEFDSVITSIGVNNVDIAMAALTITTDRAEVVNFTTPYYSAEGDEAGQVVIVLENDTTFDECTTKEQVIEKLKTL